MGGRAACGGTERSRARDMVPRMKRDECTMLDTGLSIAGEKRMGRLWDARCMVSQSSSGKRVSAKGRAIGRLHTDIDADMCSRRNCEKSIFICESAVARWLKACSAAFSLCLAFWCWPSLKYAAPITRFRAYLGTERLASAICLIISFSVSDTASSRGIVWFGC